MLSPDRIENILGFTHLGEENKKSYENQNGNRFDRILRSR